MGLPLKVKVVIPAPELISPPVRLDDFNVNVSVLAARFAGESVVGFGYFVFHGIYLFLVEVSRSKSILAGEFFFEVFDILCGQGFQPCRKADSVLVSVHPLGEQFFDDRVVHGFIYG